jgi:hypothetical protein
VRKQPRQDPLAIEQKPNYAIINIMNKKYFKVTSLRENGKDEFWSKKTYLERLAALEELRIILFGYDPTTERLQRTLAITELKKH